VNPVSDNVLRHSLAYLYLKKMVRVGRPLLRANLAKTDQSFSRTPIFNQHSIVAPQS